MEIKKDMKIAEAIMANPKSAEVMIKHGLHCIGCGVAQAETIEQGARVHGMSDDEITEMIKEMNRKVKGK